MTARFWSARTTETNSRAYLEHFQSSVLPKLRGFKGYLGATTLTRSLGGQIEILVVTGWRSLEAIRQFAGDDFEVAVVEPQAAALLTEFDQRVRHFELATSDVSWGSIGSLLGRS